jgi:serine/threonine protein phosphatase PrpC
MRTRAIALSDPGAKRDVNEDYQLSDPQLGLYVVCDGVSGQLAGKHASQACAEAIRRHVFEHKGLLEKYGKDRTLVARGQVTAMMHRAVEAANREVRRLGASDATLRGMATTVVAVLVAHDHAILANVGDSRIYLVRAGRIHQLTEDHTVVAEMRRQGLWNEKEGEKSPFSSTLTRAIGMQDYVPVDVLQIELVAGDRLILCTDGLTAYVKPPELLELSQKIDIEKLTPDLIRLAKERGGHDNITIINLMIESDMPRTDALDALKKGEVLGKVPLFRYLTYPELLKVLSLVKVRDFKPLDIVIEEGTVGDELFVVANGSIEILKAGQPVAQRGKGEFLGEIGFFNNIPRTATVRATQAATVLAFSRKDLISLLRKEPAIAVKFLWAMSQELSYRINQTTRDLADARASTKPIEAARTLPDFELPFVPENPRET